MKPSDFPELLLLHDESPPPAALEASLAAALGGARRRRARRGAGRAVAAAVLILSAGAAVMTWPGAETPGPTARTEGAGKPEAAPRAFTLVKSSSAGVVTVVTSAAAPRWSVPEKQTAMVVRTADAPPAARATDEELLAAAGDRPAALCRFPDGGARLVLLTAAPRQ